MKADENGHTIISDKESIKNNSSVIKYYCPKHGVQSMRINNYLSGKSCPECAKDASSLKHRMPIEEVINKVKECGGTLINPEDYINNSVSNLKFVCTDCGEIFTSSLSHYTQHGGRVCGNCNDTESLGEKKIRYYLENNDIDFVQEKWFSDCRDIKPLPFDFYLPGLNTVIEFDGKQHFYNNSYFKHNTEHIQAHDQIKNQYCKDNNINLIRIPYTQINHIDEILNQSLFT